MAYEEVYGATLVRATLRDYALHVVNFDLAFTAEASLGGDGVRSVRTSHFHRVASEILSENIRVMPHRRALSHEARSDPGSDRAAVYQIDNNLFSLPDLWLTSGYRLGDAHRALIVHEAVHAYADCAAPAMRPVPARSEEAAAYLAQILYFASLEPRLTATDLPPIGRACFPLARRILAERPSEANPASVTVREANSIERAVLADPRYRSTVSCYATDGVGRR